MDAHPADPPPLRVLLVEDSPDDAELISRSLRKLGRPLEIRRVASEAMLREALEQFVPELILSDYSMPGFGGHFALQLAHELAGDTPFIFVSGTIGEERAIEALKGGAYDYVLKGNLPRLPSAIERTLRNAEERRSRRNAERALRASEERFRSIVEATADWIWETDGNGCLTYSNRSVEDILGYPVASLIGRPILEMMADDERGHVEIAIPQLVAEGRGWKGHTARWKHADGSVRVLESNAVPRFDDEQRVCGYRGVDRDVTQRVQQQCKIRQLGRIHAVLSALGSAVLHTPERSHVLAQACRIAVEQGGFTSAWIATRERDGGAVCAARFGAPGAIDLSDADSPQVLPGGPVSDVLYHGDCVIVPYVTAAATLPRRQHLAAARAGIRAFIALPLGSGPWGVLSLHSNRPHDFDDDEFALLRRLAADIDFAIDFLSKSERLEYLAYHNPLTGLPNREAFRDGLQQRLARGPQLVGNVDVVRFHNFNDSRGRSFGDALLREVGRRLTAMLGDDAIVAHPGKDEFLFAVDDADGVDAQQRIDALLHAFAAKPFTIMGEEVHAQLRCGLLRTGDHPGTTDEIERNAVAAHAEAIERDVPLTLYHERLHARAVRRVELERELRRAIDEQQFVLYLQPKHEARTMRCVGAEALVRWRHPERGMVSPAEFIPVLEETGLIIPVGRWIMHEANAIASRWYAQGRRDLRIAVNVSAREMRQEAFVRDCTQLLERSARMLDIEITESMLMDDAAASMRILQALRELGCQIAIDDFGTGYSSLNYLSRLPVDVLKIDQSFVAKITASPEAMAMVSGIVSLAQALNLKLVAEGVETEEQAKLLRLLRCDELQGYLMGRPMPIDDFDAYLQRGGAKT